MTEKLLTDRLKEYHFGSNKWTKQNGPFVLLYYEKYYCKKDVLNREKFYKAGFGRRIRDLIISSVPAKGRFAYGGA